MNKPPEHQYTLYHSLFTQLVHCSIQVDDRCCVFQDAAAKKSNFQIKSTNPLAKEIKVAANIVRIERHTTHILQGEVAHNSGTMQQHLRCRGRCSFLLLIVVIWAHRTPLVQAANKCKSNRCVPSCYCQEEDDLLCAENYGAWGWYPMNPEWVSEEVWEKMPPEVRNIELFHIDLYFGISFFPLTRSLTLGCSFLFSCT